MDKQGFQRNWFFWVDRLQITKRERFALSWLFLIVAILLLVDVFVNEKMVPEPENHAEILAEFQRRSALIEREMLEQDKKYHPEDITAEEEILIPAMEVEKEVETSFINSEKISINEAGKAELMALPGIGESYAQRIIEYRETNGDFTSVDDLVKVRGIGKKTLEKLRPLIKL